VSAPNEPRTLKSQIFSASLWATGGFAFLQVWRFASHLILAKWLSPEVFGLFAIVWSIIGACNLLCDVGLQQALIRRPILDSNSLNTIWSMQLCRGLLIAALIGLIALCLKIATFNDLLPSNSTYAAPQLVLLIFASSILPIISGAESLSIALATREMNQRRVLGIEATSQIAGTLMTLACAFAYRSLWAIVIGAVTSAVVRLAMSYKVSPLRFRFAIDEKIAKEVLSFGLWILLGSLLGIAATNADKLILGTLTSASVLGQYAVALLLLGAIRDVFVKLNSAAFFPAFTKLANSDRASLSSKYYKARWVADSFSTFAFCLFFFGASTIVATLYDQRYSSAGPFLKILSISLIELRFFLTVQVWYAIGKPKFATSVIAAQAATIIIGIPVGHHFYGLDGAIWTIALSQLFTVPLTFYFKLKCKIFSLKQEIISAGVTAFIVGLCFAINFWIS
jgi:O-antigen/teichoic acid export membrane protein